MLLRQVLEAPELADAAFGELLRNSSGMSNGCSNFLAVPGPSADNERPSVGSEANAIRGDENPPFLAYCRSYAWVSNRAAGDSTQCHRVDSQPRTPHTCFHPTIARTQLATRS